MRVYLFISVSAAFVLFLLPDLVLAEPAPVSATCAISCTVAGIAEWSDASFPAIELDELSSQRNEAVGSSRLRLYTNGDVKITADNSDAAQLSKDALYKLVTEYKLEYDGLGAKQTGGGTTAWSGFDSFLREGSQARHVSGDGAVEVILSVRVFKETIRTGDSGEYSAVQTLTVCWGS